MKEDKTNNDNDHFDIWKWSGGRPFIFAEFWHPVACTSVNINSSYKHLRTVFFPAFKFVISSGGGILPSYSAWFPSNLAGLQTLDFLKLA